MKTKEEVLNKHLSIYFDIPCDCMGNMVLDCKTALKAMEEYAKLKLQEQANYKSLLKKVTQHSRLFMEGIELADFVMLTPEEIETLKNLENE